MGLEDHLPRLARKGHDEHLPAVAQPEMGSALVLDIAWLFLGSHNMPI
jgi:hypothetical protein